MMVDTNAAERKRRQVETQYRKSSHGKRSQALMAYATAGYLAPAEAIMINEVSKQDKEIEMSQQVMSILLDIQERLARIEGKLEMAPLTGSGGGEFPAVSLSCAIDGDKRYWKVKGGPFMKHGLMIWPEVMDVTPFKDADPLKAHDLTGWTAVYSENEEGHKKVTALVAPQPAPSTNGNGSQPLDSRPKAASQKQVGKGLTVGKDAAAFAAGHWRKECETATEAFMFDTAMARLEPFFPDADGVAWVREAIWGKWAAARAAACTAGLLAYSKKRRELNGSVPKLESHEAGVDAAELAFEAALAD